MCAHSMRGASNGSATDGFGRTEADLTEDHSSSPEPHPSKRKVSNRSFTCTENPFHIARRVHDVFGDASIGRPHGFTQSSRVLGFCLLGRNDSLLDCDEPHMMIAPSIPATRLSRFTVVNHSCHIDLQAAWRSWIVGTVLAASTAARWQRQALRNRVATLTHRIGSGAEDQVFYGVYRGQITSAHNLYRDAAWITRTSTELGVGPSSRRPQRRSSRGRRW